MDEPCVHVAASARISRVDLETLKFSIRGTWSGHVAMASTSGGCGREMAKEGLKTSKAGLKTGDKCGEEGDWNCVQCGTGLSPWLCLACGLIHCGRYVNQDALRHYKCHPDHQVCMDCHSMALFCYACDDYVSGSEATERRLKPVRESLSFLSRSRQSDHAYSDPSYIWPPSARPVSQSLKGGQEQNPRLLKGLKTSGPVPRKPNVISRPLAVPPAAPGPRAKSSLKKRKLNKPSASSPNLLSQRPTPAKTKRLHPEEVVLGIRGLRNLGNTCFMNAVLQSLNNIQDFACHLKQLPEKAFPSLPSTGGSVRTRRSVPDQVFLASELRKTLWALEEAGSGAISPDALFSVVWKLVPRFRGFQQQDAHEFLRCILERLGTELGCLEKSVAGSGESMVSSLFQGLLSSRVSCRRCGTSSWKRDPFLDLSLDIPQSPSGAGRDGGGGDGAVSLDACLRRFFAPEDLEGREEALCEVCQAKTPSTKQFYLRRLPDVLCLHLKRFRWQSGHKKLDNYVTFPIRSPALCLRPFLLSEAGDREDATGTDKREEEEDPGSDYDLAAVVVHHGTGAGSGHYTAYGHRSTVGPACAWYHFNDSSVRRSTEEMVRQQKAYLLFYVRNKS